MQIVKIKVKPALLGWVMVLVGVSLAVYVGVNLPLSKDNGEATSLVCGAAMALVLIIIPIFNTLADRFGPAKANN